MTKVLTNIDFDENELLRARFENLASAPPSPSIGQCYFNTTDDTAYCYTTGGWVDMLQSGGGSGGQQNKAGHIAVGSFSGDPKTASVTFTTAFADTNYSVNTTAIVNVANKSYVTQVLNKATTGFDITLGTGSTDNLTGVDWTATKHGES